MVRWIPYVFVRIVILFMVGILLAVYFPGLVPLLVAVSACAGCLVVYVAGVYIRRRHIKGLESAGLLVVLLAGYIHVLLQTESTRPDHILHLEKPITFYKATVIKSPEARNKSWKLEAAIESVKTSGQWHPQRGKVMLYYPKKDSIPVFQYGDVLIVHGTPARVPGPANPQEFDYRRFLAFRNIYHQQFLKENDVKVISNNPSSIVVQAAGRARAWCNAVLKKYISGEQEQAIAVALILGINDGLDNDLMNAYAGTGTLHVLSVSGLHVSVIYLVVLFLLRPFKNLRSGKLILAISRLTS